MSTQRTRGEGSRGPAYNARTANGPNTSNAQPDGQQQQKPRAPRPPRPDPYEHLPPFPEPGTRPRVIYTRRVEDVNTLAPFLAAGGIVGYDQEWKPNYQANQVENKVATIQVAGVHLVLVAHISDMSVFPSALRDLLESPNVLKVGVGIQSDANKLHRDFGVAMQNGFDIGGLAITIDTTTWEIELPPPKTPDAAGTPEESTTATPEPEPAESSTPSETASGQNGHKRKRDRAPKKRDPNAPKPVSTPGLARLVGHYLQLRLNKTKKVQRSNWEIAPLSYDQVDYAANDAHCGRAIYVALKQLAATLTPPEPPAEPDTRIPRYLAFDLMLDSNPAIVSLRPVDAYAPDPNLALDPGPVPAVISDFVLTTTLASDTPPIWHGNARGTGRGMGQVSAAGGSRGGRGDRSNFDYRTESQPTRGYGRGGGRGGGGSGSGNRGQRGRSRGRGSERGTD